MKTLYERLTDDSRAKISEASNRWPSTMAILKNSLQLHYAWSEMTMNDALSLHDALEPEKPFELVRFTNFFEPITK